MVCFCVSIYTSLLGGFIMKDQIVAFPIVITKNADRGDYPYFVEIPDLDGVTEGKSIIDAFEMTKDYIGTYSLENDLPKSNTVLPKNNSKNSLETLVTINISEYKRKTESH